MVHQSVASEDTELAIQEVPTGDEIPRGEKFLVELAHRASVEPGLTGAEYVAVSDDTKITGAEYVAVDGTGNTVNDQKEQ